MDTFLIQYIQTHYLEIKQEAVPVNTFHLNIWKDQQDSSAGKDTCYQATWQKENQLLLKIVI